MANKNWLLVTTVICLLAANEFGNTAARPQRTESSTQTRLVRFRPITREQYDSILKLTSGKPLISEARLINNGYRSLSSIGNSITEDLNNRLRVLLNITKMFTGDSSSQGTKGYPLCVIKTGDLESSDGNVRTTSRTGLETDTNDEQSEHSEHSGQYPSAVVYQPMYGYGGDEDSNNNNNDNDNDEQNNDSKRPIVNCIVVVKQPASNGNEDPDCVDPNMPGCSEYCRTRPLDPLCCDGEKNPECPDYCEHNPRDRENCGNEHEHEHGHGQGHENGHHHRSGSSYQRQRTSYSPYPYGYPYGAYPYYMPPPYDYRYAYAPQTSRAAPPQGFDEHVVAAVPGPAKKKAVAAQPAPKPKHRPQRKRINKPAMAETQRNIPASSSKRYEVARAGYDYSQLYQQLYNAGQMQAPYGYNQYANYQLNPYAGLGFPGAPNGASLRFPAQFQQQVYPQFGNFGNFAAQSSESGEYSSGEYSGEESGEENDDEGRAVNVKTDENEKLESKVKPKVKKLT